MAGKLFITGTGTDIGKTYVTGLIVKKLNENGLNAAYFKAAMSGNERDSDNKLIPGDAMWVKNASGISQSVDEMCPYVYENAVSPHLASRIEENPVEFDVIEKNFNEICKKYDYVTMEGSGGITCPISYDNGELYLWEVVKRLDLPCVIIADAGLGTINDVVLTVEYMRSRNIEIKGLIFNNYCQKDIMQEDNIVMCEHLTGIKTLACVAKGSKDIDIDINQLKNLY